MTTRDLVAFARANLPAEDVLELEREWHDGADQGEALVAGALPREGAAAVNRWAGWRIVGRRRAAGVCR